MGMGNVYVRHGQAAAHSQAWGSLQPVYCACKLLPGRCVVFALCSRVHPAQRSAHAPFSLPQPLPARPRSRRLRSSRRGCARAAGELPGGYLAAEPAGGDGGGAGGGGEGLGPEEGSGWVRAGGEGKSITSGDAQAAALHPGLGDLGARPGQRPRCAASGIGHRCVGCMVKDAHNLT